MDKNIDIVKIKLDAMKSSLKHESSTVQTLADEMCVSTDSVYMMLIISSETTLSFKEVVQIAVSYINRLDNTVSNVLDDVLKDCVLNGTAQPLKIMCAMCGGDINDK